ncbi:hypothetical protein ACPUYX_08425 [Desulfosporosinus sp. SYSU MS00001]|uniref:hypothetical protein n=1 Tax=Desulfosporosinus sp. SYSU MS00001 TaxID=3416284 RepID=UPI003CF5AD22
MSNRNYEKVVVLETGEVIQLPTGYIDNPHNYYIRSKSQDKAYRKCQNRSQRATEKFYWSNLDNISNLIAERKLSTSTLGLLLLLGCHLQNGSDILCNQKKNPYTTAQLVEKTGVPKRTFVRAMDELKACGIIIIEGTAKKPVYKLNTDYHFVGTNPQASKSARTYVNGVKALQESGLSLSEIGFIYAVLPLLAYDRCVLVKDRGTGEELDNPHDISSLCEYIGITRRNLSNYLNMTFEYEFKDGRYKVPVFGKFSAGGSRVYAYLMNPVIVRRAVKADLSNYDSLEAMFKIYRKKVA